MASPLYNPDGPFSSSVEFGAAMDTGNFDTFGGGLNKSYYRTSDVAKAPPTNEKISGIAYEEPGFKKSNIVGGIFAGLNDVVDLIQGDFDPAGSQIGAYAQKVAQEEQFERLLKALGDDDDSTLVRAEAGTDDDKLSKMIGKSRSKYGFDLQGNILGGLNKNLIDTYSMPIPGLTF